MPETDDTRRILVKQCYPFKTRGVQECEASRKRAMEETSRVINTDGTVVKNMLDGTTQVRTRACTCEYGCSIMMTYLASWFLGGKTPLLANSNSNAYCT